MPGQANRGIPGRIPASGYQPGMNRAIVAAALATLAFSAIVNAIVRDGTVGTGADYSAEFGITVDDQS